MTLLLVLRVPVALSGLRDLKHDTYTVEMGGWIEIVLFIDVYVCKYLCMDIHQFQFSFSGSMRTKSLCNFYVIFMYNYCLLYISLCWCVYYAINLPIPISQTLFQSYAILSSKHVFE